MTPKGKTSELISRLPIVWDKQVGNISIHRKIYAEIFRDLVDHLLGSVFEKGNAQTRD